MSEFKLTDEQLEIIDFAVNRTENLQVEARAGAAKTTTLIELAKALPDTQILALAFNKKIAQEMNERLPSNCQAKTLNGLGHRVWGQFLSKRLKLNDKKCYELLTHFVESLQDPEEKQHAYDLFAETLAAIRHGKNCGWIPNRFKGYWKPLMNDDDFFLSLDNEPSEIQQDLIIAVSQRSMQLALKGEIDFSDQILCPAICPVTFDPVELTLVDEAQDLSALNHITLKKMVKNNRLIAVGDPCQAIYAFRGADESSMNNMKKMFEMDVRYLTTAFRCGRIITENAKWRAPDMRSPDWAKEGIVEHCEQWDASSIPDGAAIICRNNAPLFRTAIRLIRDGRMPEIGGRDIAYGLVKIMKKLGKKNIKKDAALAALVAWRDKELERSRNPDSVHDKYACIKIFLDATNELGDAIVYLEKLVQRPGRIHLMTGHKSKGLEFDHVIFLDYELCRVKQNQDANIRYVIETRAKLHLQYCNTDNYVGDSQ